MKNVIAAAAALGTNGTATLQPIEPPALTIDLAKADDHAWPDMPNQRPRLGGPNGKQGRSSHQREGIAASHGGARNDMHRARRKFEMRRTMIGGEVYRYVSLVKRVRESFRRKKMTSGAAGREQNERRTARIHQIRLKGGDCSTDSFCYP